MDHAADEPSRDSVTDQKNQALSRMKTSVGNNLKARTRLSLFDILYSNSGPLHTVQSAIDGLIDNVFKEIR